MPKTKLQNIVFTLIMALFMVYVMICYNVALNIGGMSNKVFLIALSELIIMWPLACIIEYFAVEKLSKALAFKIVTPQSNPTVIMLAISTMIVCLMCPIMSLIATILFKAPGKEIIPIWLETTVLNFPMALFSQIFFVGPFVRFIFGNVFPEKNNI